MEVPYHNFTDIMIPENIHQTLIKGPKFIPFPNQNYSQLIPPIIAAIKSTKSPDLQPKLDLFTLTAIAPMYSPKTKRANMKTPKMVKSFLESNNLKLLVADKDKCFVLCTNKDFLNRANEFLKHSRSIVLKQDLTSTVLRKVHKVIALPGIVESLAGPLNPPSNVACPRLFFEAKTHKPSWPLRPLVNKCSHPTYHLEAVLAKHITSLIPRSELVTTASIEAKCTILQKLGNFPSNSY
ncbi:uncharacterized protein LOC111630456 [Centruroides sculpturatus]|uniref:uncharacterized protein LOC111630456 n=1 Tax=Centruroides sculpturatus TaxID=218467 RepID=UPI000C6E39E5|nr:uncharacterized protein LOC111630456 [Centruroides sculpturatus]